MRAVSFLLVALAGISSVGAVSPVQKVVQLLGECKTKVEADLAEESKAMQEFTKYCDDESKEKGYSIQTATRSIEDSSATAEDASATISQMDDEVSTLGSVVAAKEKELSTASAVRAGQHADFQAAEKEMVDSVDALSRAAQVLKKGASLAQTRGGHASFSSKSVQAVTALSAIIDAQWVDAGSRRTLKSFLQARASASEDDDLSLDQPQAKEVAYEGSSGGIMQTIEDMQGKAEDTLSNLRKKEMEGSQAHAMVKAGLEDEISNTKEKLATATKSKAESQQKLEETNGNLVQTKKVKEADEAYVQDLRGECQTRATEYEERMKSGKDEIGAIAKASEILSSGVTAFVQVSSRTRRMSANDDDDDEEDAESATRTKVVDILNGLAGTQHSFVFQQLASMASSDPFEKIRGLINDMIAKLVQEAQEAATHEAFCNEEIGKTKKSQDDKGMKLDKFSARVDETDSQLGQLTQSIKTLQSEMGETDKAQAEATKIRAVEHEAFLKASKDFRDSATAVAQAIEVLQNFYGGASFVQVSSKTTLKSHSKARSNQGDAANTIIAVLEMSQEDFTTLLAEAESTETEAKQTFDKMTTENKIGKASKGAEAKAKESQVKAQTNQLELNREDKASTGKELDAVNSYLDKLKPECETKTMSYADKVAARDAEIAGLKDALAILSGNGVALVQKGSSLRRIHRA